MTGKDLNSYHMVGTMYYYGIGVKANLKMAFEIFERCVNLKAPSCYNALGLMYQRGDYVKQDIIKAYSLFSSGSELGDSYSQFNQGSLLLVENGYRLHEDIEK
jgi:TPR repeat protein